MYRHWDLWSEHSNSKIIIIRPCLTATDNQEYFSSKTIAKQKIGHFLLKKTCDALKGEYISWFRTIP